MKPYLDDGDVRLYLGDCLDVLAEMDAESVDAVVCDPPYGLEFMGKDWDSFAPSAMKKRSGWDYAASGAGIDRSDRTTPQGRTGVSFHKRRSTWKCSACGKRDGFRNDHDCPGEWRHEWVDEAPSEMLAFAEWVRVWATEALRVLKPGGHMLAFGGTRTFHRLTCGIEDAGFEIRDCLSYLYGSGFPKSLDVSKAIDKAAGAERERYARPAFGGTFSDDAGTTYGTAISATPATDAAREWQGWGTALKPGWEPCVVARKPLAGTVADNVQRHGTGAVNVDGCRIGVEADDLAAMQGRSGARTAGDVFPGKGDGKAWEPTARGRWPANVALDEQAAAMLDAQSGERGGGFGVNTGKPRNAYGDYAGLGGEVVGYGDSGGASRFFYTAKASRADRNTSGANNTHPTVKPTDLMRWLVRLVTPPGGVVLDPFAGSGSTLVAARAEGFRAVGIEREQEYAAIIADRLAQLSLFTEGME